MAGFPVRTQREPRSAAFLRGGSDRAIRCRLCGTGLPRVPAVRIGKDGHPQRGGFLPPVKLPRRMFAGARLHFRHPLVIGKPASRTGTVRDISEKHGASGTLMFVTVEYQVEQDGRVRPSR